jgi:hypothetical protein
MLKLTGYILLSISCLSFILIFIMPWFDFSKTQIAGITTVLIVIGEVFFYTSIFILGKTFYAKLKAKFTFWKPKAKDIDQNSDVSNNQIAGE